MPKKPSSRRRLSLEHLETRRVLSGMVNARIEGGTLVLEGDNGNNLVSIFRGAAPGQVIVAGQKSANTSEGITRVNGSATPVVLNGFNGGIRAEMRGGDDGIGISDLTIQGSVDLSLGEGNNGVSLYGDVSIIIDEAWPKQNEYEFGAVQVAGNFSIRGGNGNDSVWMHVGDPTSVIQGDLLFYGGNGNDSLYFFGSNFVPGFSTGDGGKPDGSFDVRGNVVLNLGDGRDTVNLTRLQAGRSVRIHDVPSATGANIQLSEFSIAEDLHINSSGGGDLVLLSGGGFEYSPSFEARNIYLSTGDGNDQVQIAGGSATNLYVSTGRGDEGNGHFGVVVSKFSAANNLLIDTGDGFDNVGLGDYFSLLLGDYNGPVTARVLRLVTGSGSDGVVVHNTTAVDAVFDTGVDRDLAGVYDSTFNNFRVFLSDGDDHLYLGNMIATVWAELDGGAGNDVLTTVSPNNFKRLQRRSI